MPYVASTENVMEKWKVLNVAPMTFTCVKAINSLTISLRSISYKYIDL